MTLVLRLLMRLELVGESAFCTLGLVGKENDRCDSSFQDFSSPGFVQNNTTELPPQ